MARVEGPGIKKGASYRASETMGENLYRLRLVESEQVEPAPGAKVRLEADLVRRLGARKRRGESLAGCVDRMLRELLDGGGSIKASCDQATR